MLAIEAVGAFLQKSASTEDFTWPFGVNPEASFGANRLTTATKVANRRVSSAPPRNAPSTPAWAPRS